MDTLSTDPTCRSVFGEVQLIADEPVDGRPGRSTATVHLGPDEPAFDGHYPGFPILPGVCLIECAHRTAVASALASALPVPRLDEVEAARFFDPVFPGDTVTVEVEWEPAGDRWRCRAALRSERGPSARVRLAYEWQEQA
ncbi:3-hydroxyacyl-ACP dehydratase FabZ family protein [Streptomyces pactum]|uniref:3-hydroxyacyl-ACP dehydratase FabZ family protein n=1 Tax=Streptomyces pactum TaxID=68249 RepID=UPI0036FB317D